MADLESGNGISPNSKVNNKTPKDQISAGSALYGFDNKISGDAKESVP